MTIIGFKIAKDECAKKFIEDTNKRLQVPNIKKNPFNGYSYIIDEEATSLVIIKMNSILPNVSFVGLFLLFVIILLTGFKFSLWMIFPILLIGTGFFHSSIFIYIIAKQGLKKAGYKGFTKFVNSKYIIEFIADELRGVKIGTR